MLQNVNLLQGLTSDETKTSERLLIFIFLMMMSHESAVASSVGNNLVPRAFPSKVGRAWEKTWERGCVGK